MDERTLIALRGSIKKWEDIVAGIGLDKGEDNCPLCKLFHERFRYTGSHCDGCPVSEKTGDMSCSGSPYAAYCDEPTKAGAIAELEFLKSLLPSESDGRDEHGT